MLVCINFFNLQIVSFLFTRTSSLSLTLVSFSLMHRLCKQKLKRGGVNLQSLKKNDNNKI